MTSRACPSLLAELMDSASLLCIRSCLMHHAYNV